MELAPADGAQHVFGYTSFLVTRSSLLETLLSLVNCFTSLIQASTTGQEAPTWKAASDQIVAKAHQVVSQAGTPAGTSSDPSADASLAASELAAKGQELQRIALSAHSTISASGLAQQGGAPGLRSRSGRLPARVGNAGCQRVGNPPGRAVRPKPS